MKYHGQNLEDQFVHRYFGDYKGTLLDIGANRGDYLSNSLALINLGWAGHLIEPASVFADLQALHANNPRVKCYNYGIGEKEDTLTFYESGAHVPGGTDKALVSSFDLSELGRWEGVKFEEKQIKVVPFDIFWLEAGLPVFDFISLDAENFDWLILQQIDLVAVGCKCLCIEWNSDYQLYRKFVDYCAAARLTLKVQNAENLIFVK
ncbi:FkbM family methyltransferase [Mucilaginibacter sp.]|jgi:FkbM family methyltransferase|uniref:FkbM family methyltransferase n=1 Tax=Mucilaginibacter sp. TaxID=1882438 RepID=UPI003563776A